MNNNQRAQQLESGGSAQLPRLAIKKPKREKQIRVTTETYEALMDLGKMSDDFEDVIARLLKFYNEHQK